MKALLLAALLVALPLAGCASDAPKAPAAGEAIRYGDAATDAVGWAPLESAKIRPGMMIHTAQRDCPSNFLFARPDNTSVFLGTSAYCVREMRVGGIASIAGVEESILVLVYSSYQTMAEINDQNPTTNEYNDFAVFKVDESVRKWVNPTLLRYGGPVALAPHLATGERVRTYAPLADGLPDDAHQREGVVGGEIGEWAYLAYGVPALPGAMGSGAVTSDGKAVGIVVNLGVAPNPGSNAIARLDKAMAYAKEHAKLDMALVTSDPIPAGLLASTPSP